MGKWFLACALLLLTGRPAGAEELETLLGVRTDFDAGRLVFEVASSGCTEKADFRATVDNGTLSLFRLQRDSCKAMPFRTQLLFGLEELGLSAQQPFRLANPLVVNEHMALR